MVMRHGGAHLIKPFVKMTTLRGSFGTKGMTSLEAEPQGRLLVFIRDPRNRIVSTYRWTKQHNGKKISKLTRAAGEDSDDARIAALMTRRDEDGLSLMQFMHVWAERWCWWPGALVVTFEGFADPGSGPNEAKRIARFLGADENHALDVYSKHIGHGTFTGRHSQWKEWFGPRAKKAWKENNGKLLLGTMGYAGT